MDRAQALINSLDNPEDYVIHKLRVTQESLEEFLMDEVKVSALITTKTFSDGSPVLKTFSRNNQYVKFEFQLNKDYFVVSDCECEHFYWYDNGIWYQTDEYTEMAPFLQ